MVIDDAFFMQLAINEAWKYQFLTLPNPPVGALIKDQNQQILSIEAHKQSGHEHAELEAIKEAIYKKTNDSKLKNINNPIKIYEYITQKYKKFFHNSTMYVTLEPCNHFGKTPPCSNIIKEMGLKGVVIGLNDENKIAAGGAEFLKKSGIKVDIGVLSDSVKILIEPFLKIKNDKFILFKTALTQNGVYDGGIISSLSSRKLVHKIRQKIDLLVVGGKSVREDRPILDTRLCDKNIPPDILIISTKDNFDRSIPLFNVKDRRVIISESIEILNDYKFIMVESAGGLYELLKEKIDWYMFFIAPFFKSGKNLQNSLKLKTLHSIKNDEDLILYQKLVNK